MTSIHVRRLRSEVNCTAARFVDYATRHGVPAAELPSVKLPWFEVRATSGDAPDGAAPDGDDTAEILLFDEIGGSFGVSAAEFVDALSDITAPTVRLRINSPGGSVFDALTIASALRHHPAHVVAYVDGVAASAASFVATAADEVVMMPGSQMMIHDASATEKGNAADHRHMATFLDRQSDNIASLYQLKGGGDTVEWRELMREETWMFADEAVGFGLADRVAHTRPPVVDEAEEELLTRSFDLSQFRYAGRAHAPAPSKRTTRTPARVEVRTAPVATPVSDRAAAAAARAEALGGGPGLLPADTGRDRHAPARAALRAALQDRNGKQMHHLTGIASVTDTPYPMWDSFGEYDEVITRAAFIQTLARQPDVNFLVNHTGLAMARTTAREGSRPTLELSLVDAGLQVDAWLNPERSDIRDLIAAIDDGAVTEMSFAFILQEGRWSEDYSTFEITRLDLNRGDVSAVNYGANPYTSIAARSRAILSDLAHLPAGAARAALAQLAARPDLQPPPPVMAAPTAPPVVVKAPTGSVTWYEAHQAFN